MSFPTRAGIATAFFACAIASNSLHMALAQTHASAAAKPTTAAAATRSIATAAVVDQPRGTGYFVGDQVTQRVLLERAGQSVTPVSLPAPGRVSAWFERRTASIQADTSSRPWLVIEYQILNAPSKLTTVKLPAWSVLIKRAHQPEAAGPPADNSGGASTLRIPAVSINIAPLSLPGSPTQVGAADLRPDRFPPVMATAPLWRSVEVSAGTLCLTLFAWLAWVIWRNRRALATQPFANALRQMRTLDDGEPRAWQVLHRAFDQTAGRVIQHSTLSALFESAPQLTPVRTEIEQFFAKSSVLFFGAPQPGALARPWPKSANDSSTTRSRPLKQHSPFAPDFHADGPSLHALCVELRRIEKRHER
jgi:mxaA protein